MVEECGLVSRPGVLREGLISTSDRKELMVWVVGIGDEVDIVCGEVVLV